MMRSVSQPMIFSLLDKPFIFHETIFQLITVKIKVGISNMTLVFITCLNFICSQLLCQGLCRSTKFILEKGQQKNYSIKISACMCAFKRLCVHICRCIFMCRWWTHTCVCEREMPACYHITKNEKAGGTKLNGCKRKIQTKKERIRSR